MIRVVGQLWIKQYFANTGRRQIKNILVIIHWSRLDNRHSSIYQKKDGMAYSIFCYVSLGMDRVQVIYLYWFEDGINNFNDQEQHNAYWNIQVREDIQPLDSMMAPLIRRIRICFGINLKCGIFYFNSHVQTCQFVALHHYNRCGGAIRQDFREWFSTSWMRIRANSFRDTFGERHNVKHARERNPLEDRELHMLDLGVYLLSIFWKPRIKIYNKNANISF